MSSFPQFHVIPKKHIVSKRLAQCLNPALPAGVHAKTLEVYLQIFTKLGKDNLAGNLAVYSYGFFPFFMHANMSVKPLLLDIFNNHFIPLKLDLLPCLSGLLSSILPGLDEEGSEFFPKV